MVKPNRLVQILRMVLIIDPYSVSCMKPILFGWRHSAISLGGGVFPDQAREGNTTFDDLCEGTQTITHAGGKYASRRMLEFSGVGMMCAG